MPSQENKRSKLAAHLEPWTIVILLLALAAALYAPARNALVARADARVVAAQSKTVELAVLTVSAQCRADGTAFADQTGPGGFAEGIEERIRALSGCPGRVYLLQWDPESWRAVELLYVEDGFQALYRRTDDGASWTTSRVSPIYAKNGT